jgi:hypothetical protein
VLLPLLNIGQLVVCGTITLFLRGLPTPPPQSAEAIQELLELSHTPPCDARVGAPATLAALGALAPCDARVGAPTTLARLGALAPCDARV